MKVCVICGGELLTGAKKYCPKCKEVQYLKGRRKAQLKLYCRLKELEPVRTCIKCGRLKHHNAKCNVCIDCYTVKHELTKNINKRKPKPIKKSAEDLLFLSLINKARLSNHALSNKIRKSTAQESEELWLQRSASSGNQEAENQQQ